MQLPFTVEQFFDAFSAYNQALWPSQIALVGLATVAVGLALRPNRWSSVAISAILAFLWAWLAIAYHLAFFTMINPLAYLFALASLLGAIAFLWHGVLCRRLVFRYPGNTHGVIGLGLIVFALIAYPAWSWYAGHRYPALPTFGLPCPTTLFTIGLSGFLVAPYPRAPLIVPVLWSFVGGQAAFLLDVPQDLGLLVAGVIGLVWLARSGREMNTPSRESA